MMTGRPSAQRPAVDWSRDWLRQTRWAEAAERAPDTASLVQTAVIGSGVNPALIDQQLAGRYARQAIVHAAHHLLQQTGNSSGARAVLLVSLRGDLCDELLWNFFTHQGANGVAVRNHLISSYLCSGELTDSLVGGIRDGSLLQEGGDKDVQDQG